MQILIALIAGVIRAIRICMGRESFFFKIGRAHV